MFLYANLISLRASRRQQCGGDRVRVLGWVQDCITSAIIFCKFI